MSNHNPPAADQVEVTIFGSGFGECILCHVGGGYWICVDSAVNPESGVPVALEYLTSIGLNPADALKWIVVSHWHDDHIRGISKIAKNCPGARIAMAGAMRQQEFLTYIDIYANDKTIKTGSGVTEIAAVAELAALRGDTIKLAGPNSGLFEFGPGAFPHGLSVKASTLSPSDAQLQNFLQGIAAMMPAVRETRMRATPQSPNMLSVVVWVDVGGECILLGADLEEHGHPAMGWSAILSSPARPTTSARIFKIPHHGSANAHHDDVWKDMVVVDSPIALLAPYNRGHKLPSAADVGRITARTTQAFASSDGAPTKPARRREKRVERTIEEEKINIRSIGTGYGFARVRNGGESQPSNWTVELYGRAVPLGKFQTTR